MESDKKQQLLWGCWFLIVNVLDFRLMSLTGRLLNVQVEFMIIGLGQCHVSSRDLSKRNIINSKVPASMAYVSFL